MIKVLRRLPIEVRGQLRVRPQPDWIPPMLATPSEARPTSGKWLYEPKLDGVRGLAFIKGAAVRLLSRNRKPLDGTYPEIALGLESAVRGDAILDGEIVAVDPASGLSSFQLLQNWKGLRQVAPGNRGRIQLRYYVFDCLHYDGIDLTRLPLIYRKGILREVVRFDRRIRHTPFRTTGGETMYREACAKGAEGILAKRAEGRYLSGRSTEWLKLKCVSDQEFVIGGYTEPKGARDHFGALLVGYYDDAGKLQFAGKVGTGYDRQALEQLHGALQGLRRATSPFATPLARSVKATWVKPVLVAQIGFSEWTSAGLLRHPRFLGLRDDKDAREVRRS